MYKIAVCDDKITIVKGIEEYLYNYFREKTAEYSIAYFSTPIELFEAMRNDIYNIVFMDLVFDSEESDGIIWSKKIYEQYPDTIVMILTAYESRVKEGYVARAFRFMTKPIIEQELYENMDACIKELGGHQKIHLNTMGVELQIEVRHIIYFEAYVGGSTVYIGDKHYYSEKSLLQYELDLPESLFFRSHKKYLVNLGCIHKLENHMIVLKGGTKLPVSRRKWTRLREEYMKYDIGRL